MNALCRSSKKSGYRAQAITEFAIVLPILLMLLLGILEVGRLIYIYAVITNASRDAARYGSAIGLDDSGLYNKYEYCQGIEETAKRFAYFIPLTITIEYDKGPDTAAYDSCVSTNGTGSDDVAVSAGDRVLVTVETTYSPLVKLIPISGRDIVSSSARTILGEVNLATGQSSIPVGGPMGGPVGGSEGGPSGSSSTPTNTPTSTPTNTPMATSTSTLTNPDPWYTPPPLDTSTPTPESTVMPTNTPTATSTSTPTATATAMPGCDSITHGDISIFGNSMSMWIRNPHATLTVSSVRVVWNPFGGPNGSSLTLQYASLENLFWTGSDNTGDLTIEPSTTVTIPGNNTTSTIFFTFSKAYKTPGTTIPSITINISTPGCEDYQIKNP